MTTPPPPSLFSPHGGCSKRRIDGCLVDIDNEDVSQSPPCPRSLLQPVSLHLSFNKTGIMSLRLRVSVALRDDPGLTAILLDIPADKIESLSLSRQPTLPERLKSKIHRSQARLQVTVSNSAGILIAPSDIEALNPERSLDAQALETMQMLSRSRRILTYLPVGDNLWEYVSAAQGTAVSNLAMSLELLLQVAESPVHLDLMTLYAGKGGRIISSSEAFGQPVIEDDAQDSSSVGDGSSTQEADLPPSYNDTVPHGAANSARKRLRSSPGDDAPQSRKGEASDDKAGRLDGLREAWDQAGAMIEKLRESTAAAAAMDARLRATVLELKKAQQQKSPPPNAASSPAASTAETASHTSSVSETMSEKLKSYLDDRLARFSQDMRMYYNRRLEQRLDEVLADYSTIEYMEQHVWLEFGELAVDFVDEHEMWDAIQEAVDKVEENMRTRMLDAWT
ncbi:hypothetical protein KVR01_007337 [Diaporthe batatas]|uniref:uncharacterized protein n=1 Tax=Diaporthe batatas TaxID=748121 RepID=UPI001D0397BA|nr:uncharacterized protein KVR01_007337 [Diaporthe batatas]KAG8162859.1 hypothetical protein KVR01_007337 [Diaporthe batatas]